MKPETCGGGTIFWLQAIILGTEKSTKPGGGTLWYLPSTGEGLGCDMRRPKYAWGTEEEKTV